MLFTGGRDKLGVDTEAGLSEGGGPRAESKVQVRGTREDRIPGEKASRWQALNLDQKGSTFILCATIQSVNQQSLRSSHVVPGTMRGPGDMQMMTVEHAASVGMRPCQGATRLWHMRRAVLGGVKQERLGHGAPCSSAGTSSGKGQHCAQNAWQGTAVISPENEIVPQDGDPGLS